MTDAQFRVLPSGDTALVLEFGSEIDQAVSRRVLALHRRLRDLDWRGVVGSVPTFRSLLVHYDPDLIATEVLEEQLGALADEVDDVADQGRSWRLPACYDIAVAPDINDVATTTDMTPDQVVECHSGTAYHVYMVGFLPGYPYMGDVPEALVLPRREEPRVAVPPGSLAIATTMTAVYPLESPGGWHLIGRSPVRLFDPARAEPILLAPGDTVRFEPIDLDIYETLEEQARAGALSVEVEGPEL